MSYNPSQVILKYTLKLPDLGYSYFVTLTKSLYLIPCLFL